MNNTGLFLATRSPYDCFLVNEVEKNRYFGILYLHQHSNLWETTLSYNFRSIFRQILDKVNTNEFCICKISISIQMRSCAPAWVGISTESKFLKKGFLKYCHVNNDVNNDSLHCNCSNKTSNTCSAVRFQKQLSRNSIIWTGRDTRSW